MPLDQVIQTVEALAVPVAAAAPEVATVVVCVASTAVAGYGSYYAAQWAIQDTGPNYPLSAEYAPGAIQATYALPGVSTLAIDTGITAGLVLAVPKGVISMADHLDFLLSAGAAGMPGSPGDPFNRHDPNKPNDPKVNGRHIRNALQGIQRNLGNSDLRTYLQQYLKPDQFAYLTESLDNLVQDLTNQGYFYEQMGADISDDILTLLTEMGYVVP